MAFIFDGSSINPFNGINFRISGARHGKWINTQPGTTGTVNMLFFDGHAASIGRKQMPSVGGNLDGSALSLSKAYPYPLWRLDQP